eukprot:72933-Heterocapsa_arctica.AAC.1
MKILISVSNSYFGVPVWLLWSEEAGSDPLPFEKPASASHGSRAQARELMGATCRQTEAARSGD